MLEDLLAVLGSAGFLDAGNDSLNLLVGDEAALYTGRFALAERRVEHIALADQLFRAGRIQNDAGFDLAGYRKRDARRDIRFHDAGDNVRRRSLGRDNEVHTCGTRFLRDTADGVLDLLGGDHHQVGQLVDNDDDLREHLILLGRSVLGLLGLGLFRAHKVVIADQITHLMIREQLVAAFHLPDCPVERTGGLFRVGDDRDEQMRDAVVVAQLDHLRVYHNEADLLRRGLVEQRDQHGVDAHRLTGAGRTGDEHMRHLGDVTDDRLAGDVLADGKGQAAFRIRERRRADTLADKDGIDRLVRHLDADRDLIRDRRDTHVRRTERQRNIVRQGGDARDFNAARDGQLEPGDGRAAHDADDLRLDVERVERIEQARGVLAQLGFCTRDRGVLALCQQVERRIVVDRHGRFLALVDGDIHGFLLGFRDVFGLFRLGSRCGLRSRRGCGLRFGNRRRFFLRLLVLDEIHDAARLFLHIIAQRTQIFVRRDGLALALVRIDELLARLILPGRLGVYRDVKVGFTLCTALLSALCRRCGRFMEVRQLHGRFVVFALRLVLIFVLRRTEHLDERLRRDAARGHQCCEHEQDEHEQCADGGQSPLEQDIQPAGQQTARGSLHAGGEQRGQRTHGQVVGIRAGEGVHDAAQQHRQQHDARSAQAHRTLRAHEQQHGQRDQRERHEKRAPADERRDAAVQPLEQHAVYRQQRQQAYHAECSPYRSPRRTREQRALLLRLGRPLASGGGLCRFFCRCFPCSQWLLSFHFL